MDKNQKDSRPKLYARRKLGKRSLSKLILENSEDKPVPTEQSLVFWVPPPPSPPPPPPSPIGSQQQPIKQLEKLPFALSFSNRFPFGLSQLTLWMCSYCLSESTNNTRVYQTSDEQLKIQLTLCKHCVECNQEMQTAASSVWENYWKEKKGTSNNKRKREEDKGTEDKKKRFKKLIPQDM